MADLARGDAAGLSSRLASVVEIASVWVEDGSVMVLPMGGGRNPAAPNQTRRGSSPRRKKRAVAKPGEDLLDVPDHPQATDPCPLGGACTVGLEHLVLPARGVSGNLEDETARWLTELSDTMYSRLAAVPCRQLYRRIRRFVHRCAIHRPIV